VIGIFAYPHAARLRQRKGSRLCRRLANFCTTF
jgi:hypothetical protein